MTPAIVRVLQKCSLSESGCLEYGGSLVRGYGKVKALSDSGVWKQVSVHRLVYEYFVGAIPDGYQIDHLCRNGSCCRLDHLEAVDQRTNLRRSKGWSNDSGVWLCGRGHAVSGTAVHGASSSPHWVVCGACRTERRRMRRNTEATKDCKRG